MPEVNFFRRLLWIFECLPRQRNASIARRLSLSIPEPDSTPQPFRE